jgi:hypothetical protein
VAGDKCPAPWVLGKLAKELQLDLSVVLLMKEHCDAAYAAASAKDGQADGWEHVLLTLSTDLAKAQSKPKKHPPSAFLSLCDWPSGFDVRTILVGDRRESPPHNAADVLVKPASTADLMYVSDLHLENQEIPPRIRSDKIILLANPVALQTKLDSDLLVVGSPAANLGSRELNAGACFRFQVDPTVQKIEEKFRNDLQPIKYDREALEQFVDVNQDRERVSRLHYMLEGFARPGFIDPTSALGLRGVSTRNWNDFGVVSLCKHPWAENRVAVMVAGVKGPATAAGLKLLGTEGAFKDHPLGGVFTVNISTDASWEDRYDLLKPRWDTNPYDLAKYRKGVDASSFLSASEKKCIEGLIELLKRRAASPSSKVSAS